MHPANCPQDAFISLTSPLHLSPISLRSVHATERAGSCGGREYRAVIDALPYWRRTRPKDGERDRRLTLVYQNCMALGAWRETEEAYCVWGSETAAVTEITVPAEEEDKGKKGWLAP